MGAGWFFPCAMNHFCPSWLVRRPSSLFGFGLAATDLLLPRSWFTWSFVSCRRVCTRNVFLALGLLRASAFFFSGRVAPSEDCLLCLGLVPIVTVSRAKALRPRRDLFSVFLLGLDSRASPVLHWNPFMPLRFSWSGCSREFQDNMCRHVSGMKWLAYLLGMLWKVCLTRMSEKLT
jgi:hypothetical protein